MRAFSNREMYYGRGPSFTHCYGPHPAIVRYHMPPDRCCRCCRGSRAWLTLLLPGCCVFYGCSRSWLRMVSSTGPRLLLLPSLCSDPRWGRTAEVYSEDPKVGDMPLQGLRQGCAAQAGVSWTLSLCRAPLDCPQLGLATLLPTDSRHAELLQPQLAAQAVRSSAVARASSPPPKSVSWCRFLTCRWPPTWPTCSFRGCRAGGARRAHPLPSKSPPRARRASSGGWVGRGDSASMNSGRTRNPLLAMHADM